VSRPVLVCFAVPEEARPLARAAPAHARILVTGMGPANSRAALLPVLDGPEPPPLVLTCGFAGGLDPALRRPSVLFDADPGTPVGEALRQAGALPARFHGADRVAITAADKRRLREATGADAVEMESWCIRALCRERGIPAATVRAVSDEADEDLPLDFNALLDERMRLRPGRLMLALFRSPGVVPGVWRLGRHTREAARRLAAVLRQTLGLVAECLS
jgi:hypothetical protein